MGYDNNSVSLGETDMPHIVANESLQIPPYHDHTRCPFCRPSDQQQGQITSESRSAESRNTVLENIIEQAMKEPLPGGLMPYYFNSHVGAAVTKNKMPSDIVKTIVC